MPISHYDMIINMNYYKLFSTGFIDMSLTGNPELQLQSIPVSNV